MPTRLAWSVVTLSPEDEAAIMELAYAPKAVGQAAARRLRALCRLVQPRRIIEVGTLVGMSTRALIASEAIYTCDSGECRTVFEAPHIFAHWQTLSTEMLRQLWKVGVEDIDLVFYDATVQRADVPLLQNLTHPATVFAFHDYRGAEKGVRGVRAVTPLVPRHQLIVADDDTGMAVLAPEAIAWRLVGGHT